jgi:hypothetical protein
VGRFGKFRGRGFAGVVGGVALGLLTWWQITPVLATLKWLGSNSEGVGIVYGLLRAAACIGEALLPADFRAKPNESSWLLKTLGPWMGGVVASVLDALTVYACCSVTYLLWVSEPLISSVPLAERILATGAFVVLLWGLLVGVTQHVVRVLFPQSQAKGQNIEPVS